MNMPLSMSGFILTTPDAIVRVLIVTTALAALGVVVVVFFVTRGRVVGK